MTECRDTRACETTQAKQPKEAKHLKYSEPEKQEEEAMQTKEPKLINQGLGKTVQDQEPINRLLAGHYMSLYTAYLPLVLVSRFLCCLPYCVSVELAASLGCCSYRGLVVERHRILLKRWTSTITFIIRTSRKRQTSALQSARVRFVFDTYILDQRCASRVDLQREL